jgi:hypothetical protein
MTGIFPIWASLSRNGRMAQAVAANIAQPPTWTWAESRGGPK